MNKEFKEAFDSIHASQTLINDTKTALFSSKKKYSMNWKLVPALCVVCVCLFVMYTIRTPYTYISIDVNPSIELSLNRYNRVIGINGYNEESEIVVASINVLNQPYLKALSTIDDALDNLGYFNRNSVISYAVASSSKTTEDSIIDAIVSSTMYTEHQSYCHGADVNQHEEAHQSGMSIGKYQLYLELHEYDESVSVESCQHMSMHEMYTMLEEYTDDGPKEHGHHQHHGN